MFIEITDTQGGFTTSININHIVSILKSNDNCRIDTAVHNFGQQIIVQESYEEVKEKIAEASRPSIDPDDLPF
ncbi:hypothetical protein [Gracilibacillus thailandensis]|uniref:Uncharacterized protein n=1 Tax=Gracilibacillus thailandensis TaxID=563735 RepID=A0A6N7QUC1_9BACI|nr:hypothetical protein [Gracilibacillus thailandensis]MRI65134.1 hypothetical protein [Gracilibacillus thailandensis]